MRLSFGVIINNTEVVPGIFRIWLQIPELAEEVRPGQFMMVQCGEDTVLRRPLSVHRVDGSKIALLFQIRGKGTEWLSRQKKGNKINVLGVMGNGFQIASGARSILLVAGGIGIAPLYHLVEHALKVNRKVTLLMGAATKGQLYPLSSLPSEVKIVLATEDGSIGYKGMVTELIQGYASSTEQVFACGPLPMLHYMAENKNRLKINGMQTQVSLEMRMACGLGVCYGCTIRTKNGLKQVCKDGPVFNINDIIWDDFIRL